MTAALIALAAAVGYLAGRTRPWQEAWDAMEWWAFKNQHRRLPWYRKYTSDAITFGMIARALVRRPIVTIRRLRGRPEPLRRTADQPIRIPSPPKLRAEHVAYLRRREAILAARKAHRADSYRDYRHEPRPPSGCAWCGLPQRNHCQRWSADAGWHRYEPPADWQILARMRARRVLELAESTGFTQEARMLARRAILSPDER